MTTASPPLATVLWGARFAGDWLPSCYTTWGDTTLHGLAVDQLNKLLQNQIATVGSVRAAPQSAKHRTVAT